LIIYGWWFYYNRFAKGLSRKILGKEEWEKLQWRGEDCARFFEFGCVIYSAIHSYGILSSRLPTLSK